MISRDFLNLKQYSYYFKIVLLTLKQETDWSFLQANHSNDFSSNLISPSQAFINMTGGRRNRTALHYASIANNDAIVKLLLRHNADQEIVDATGYTALNLSNGGEVCRLLHQVKCVYINSY